jgi:hypothetical protein
MKTVLVALVITTNWLTYCEPVPMVPVTNGIPSNKWGICCFEPRPADSTNPATYFDWVTVEKPVVSTSYLPVVEMEVPDE